MKFIVFVALSIVTIAIATPIASRLRRQANSGCTDRSNLASVLEQVGNLVSNLLDNLPLLGQLNLTGKGDLLDLTDLLIALGDVLTDLLGTGLNGSTQGLVDRLDSLISGVNKLLGGKQGSAWACKSSNSTTSGDIAKLIRGVHVYPGLPNLLIGVLNLLYTLLGSLARLVHIPVPANTLAPLAG